MPSLSLAAEGHSSDRGKGYGWRGQFFAREVFTDAWLSSKQREPARYRPRAPAFASRSEYEGCPT